MFLKIDEVTIIVNTEKLVFEKKIKFRQGINIIRGDNGAGKSTLLNSILYGLGTERIIDFKRNEKIFPEALVDTLEYSGNRYEVESSFLMMQISNKNGKKITLKRWIKSADYDPRLMIVYHSELNTINESNKSTFFVNDPGAVVNEKGFHNFLQKFLDLELPEVPLKKPRRSGKTKVPLYFECFFPLFFIEQKRGWSNLTANVPFYYGIKDLEKYIVAFILNLEIFKLETEYNDLVIKNQQVKEEWIHLKNKSESLAEEHSLVLNGFPKQIPNKLLRSKYPRLMINHEKGLKELSTYLLQMDDELDALNQSYLKSDKDLEKKRNELDQLKEKQSRIKLKITEIDELIHEKNASEFQLVEKINLLKDDIRKNNDLKKLNQYGSEIANFPSFDNCPTCGHLLHGVLSMSEQNDNPMNIEDNIMYLKQQKVTTESLLNQVRKEKKLLNSKNAGLIDTFFEIVNQIKDLNASLIEPSRLGNTAEIRQKIRKEEKIKYLHKLKKEFTSDLAKVPDLIHLSNQIQKNLKNYPDEFLSGSDNIKIKYLMDHLFRKYLELFQFRSKNELEIGYDKDKLIPKILGFKSESIYNSEFRFAASDNIRYIWAFTLALLKFSVSKDSNHFGFLIYDEPKQQNIDEEDLHTFYEEIDNLKDKEIQVLIATSEKIESFQSIFHKQDHVNIISLDGKLLIPVEK